jgi:8-oxo-dGTP pyrophosphatase MutT (NUDIX family)
MKRDESFGVVPLSKTSGQWEVFLIQHNRSGYWGFPKGHAEPHETAEAAAFRELKEETNLEPLRLIQTEPLLEQYTFMMEGKRVHKQVTYFIAEVTGKVKLQTKEIHDGRWVPLKEAIHQITHQEGKSIIAQVEKLLDALS